MFVSNHIWIVDDLVDNGFLQLKIGRVTPYDHTVSPIDFRGDGILGFSRHLGNGVTHRFRKRAQNLQCLFNGAAAQTRLDILHFDDGNSIHGGTADGIQYTALAIDRGHAVFTCLKHRSRLLRFDGHFKGIRKLLLGLRGGDSRYFLDFLLHIIV